jgi:hypothetical protein
MIWIFVYLSILSVACFSEKPLLRTEKGIPEEWTQTGSLRSGVSSSFFQEGGLRYEGSLAADGNPKTSWCAQKGDKQAWVRISSPCSGALVGLMVRNGFAESPISFGQRDRVREAEVVLRVDDTEVWSKRIGFLDVIRPQHLDFEDVACATNYSLQLNVLRRKEDVGVLCLSELQAMVSVENPMSIIQGEDEDAIEVPARVTLRVYAGPSEEHTLIGHAPILLTQYGAPFVRIVEQRGEFVRFDRLRRRFEAHESPPALNDPLFGGWVHRNQLDWDLSFPY